MYIYKYIFTYNCVCPYKRYTEKAALCIEYVIDFNSYTYISVYTYIHVCIYTCIYAYTHAQTHTLRV